jgi:hypothetical protein
VTTSEILRQAKAELLVRGWCQAVYANRAGEVCAHGALGLAVGCFSVRSTGGVSVNIHSTTFPFAADRVLAGVVGRCVTEWNDDPRRTPEDVLAAFDAAIAIAEMQEQQEALPLEVV